MRQCGWVVDPRYGELCKKFDFEAEQDPLGLWQTLRLIWGHGGMAFGHSCVEMVNHLQRPHESMPEEWLSGLEEGVGVFPARLEQIIEAFESSELPSFQELLRILCGGSATQNCTFCSSCISAVVVFDMVDDYDDLDEDGVPAVVLQPYLPPTFTCGAASCNRQMQDKLD